MRLECKECKDNMFKDENGLCSLHCEEKFPECTQCADDGSECFRCEFGFHLGQLSHCYKTSKNVCPIINGNQQWWNSTSRSCEDCLVENCKFCGSDGSCEECSDGFLPT